MFETKEDIISFLKTGEILKFGNFLIRYENDQLEYKSFDGKWKASCLKLNYPEKAEKIKKTTATFNKGNVHSCLFNIRTKHI